MSEFDASKQAQLFASLQQSRFNGELVLTDPKEQEWLFYLCQGQLVYATGGPYPRRRWQRNLADHCPHIPANAGAKALALHQKHQLSGTATQDLTFCNEYRLLCLWVEQQKITQAQAVKMIQSVILEVLFDVTQAGCTAYGFNQGNPLSPQLTLFDSSQLIAAAAQIWQRWQIAGITDISPNLAPVIRQTKQLQAGASPVHPTRMKLLDGKHTLRELAVMMKRDVAEVTGLLLSHIELGLVDLVEIADLPSEITSHPDRTDIAGTQPTANMPRSSSISNSLTTPPKSSAPTRLTAPSGPLIACVDDSPMICQAMENILTSAGYQFIGVNDALRASAILLARKPELIFLDLVMPNVNGYEICGALRRSSIFRNTPIVILTGKDGIVDRVRAKLVRSTDFISKPIDEEKLLMIIQKYLRHSTAT